MPWRDAAVEQDEIETLAMYDDGPRLNDWSIVTIKLTNYYS